MAQNVQTLSITNFHGSMTQYNDGDINSGLANETISFGYDPFLKPGNLTWAEDPELVDSDASVITDMIVAGKARVESGVVYVYAIGHTGRLYKIQVNDPSTYNVNYDNPVLLATLAAQSPTFKRGGFIDFFGATERIYIGHDKGVTRIDFDGTNETFVGALGSWIQDVPRPFVQFLGKLYIGNGGNLAEVDSTATVTSYSKLSPAFPQGTQVRDIDVTPEGTYLQAVVTELALADITLTTPDTSLLLPTDSYVFKWNGVDTGYTSYITYPGVVLTANALFGASEFAFGHDFRGGAVFNPIRKILTSSPETSQESPLPNAVLPISNLIAWASPLPFEGFTYPTLNVFGTVSEGQIKAGYWSLFSPAPTSPETDVMRVPCMILVSNFAQGTSSNGYTSQIYGQPKVYISVMETSSAPTTKYRLYRWSPSPTGLGDATADAIYQTQLQLFSKKISVKQVRIYGEPWVANNSFLIDLIGSSATQTAGTPITGGSKTFTAGSTLTVGDDFAWYNPSCAPTYALGIRITNKGTKNMVITKIEIDYVAGGK